uniref:Uncharacterized protein n=1 Tax=Strongyloides papillosus TaxID=174720 RepID=A0A0N5CFL1_STREA
MSRSTNPNLNAQSDEDSDELGINKRSFPPFEWLFNNRFYNIYPFFNRLHTVDPDEQELINEIDDTYGFSSNSDTKEDDNNDEKYPIDEIQPESIINDDSQDNNGDSPNEELEEQDSTDERRDYDLRPRLTTINYKE